MKKRWTALLLSLILMLSTAACGNSAGGDASSGAGSSAPSSSVEAGAEDTDQEIPEEDVSTQPADTSGEETGEEPKENEDLTEPAGKPTEKPTAKPVETPVVSKPAAKPAGSQKPSSSTAASGGSSSAAGSSADAQVDLAAFYSTLNSKFDLPPSMAALSQEEIDAFYAGLSDLKPVQCVVYMPMISAVACEVALVECASEDDAASVKSIFQSRIDYQVNTGAFYPETIELWETQSGIYSHGKYVMLYCGDNGSQVAAAFQALFDGAK